MTPPAPHKHARVVFAALFAILVGIEASGLLPESNPLRALAAWAWVSFSILVLVSIVADALLPLTWGAFWTSPDVGWYLAALLVPVGLLLFGITGYTYTQINDEGLQQVVSGLVLIADRRDLGLFGLGFLGYPARHYLLAALPSYLLGRSLITLRIGFGLLYLGAYISFLAAVRSYLEARKAQGPMLLASVAGTGVALGSYPLLYSRLFEQTSVPLAATLLFLAGLLRFLVRPGPLPGLWFIWALGFMPYTYTPSLAAWALGMALLAYLACRGSPIPKGPIWAGLSYGALTAAISTVLQVRAGLFPGRLSIGGTSDSIAAGFSGSGAQGWASRLLEGFHATLGIDETLIPAPLALGVIFILMHSLRRKDYRVLGLCLWAGATLVLSLALKGYWQRVPEIDIQRAMVVLPPLSVALVLYVSAHAQEFPDGRVKRGLLVSGVLFMLLGSAYVPLIRRVPRAYYPFAVTDREEAAMLVVNTAGQGAKTVYLLPPLYFPLEEPLRYFSPGTRVVRGFPPGGEHRPGVYVISYIGVEPYRAEDPYARFADHPVRYRHPGPTIGISPE